MELLDNINNKTLIICSNSNKKLILKEMNKYNKLFNIKFMTKDEFYKKCYFDYDEQTIYYLMNKYHIKYDISLSYIKYLMYINDSNYGNSKLDFLCFLKDELKDLLYFDDEFKNYINTFNIVVYGYYVDNFFKKTLDLFSNVSIYDKSNNYIHSVNHFESIESEVEFVAQSICKLSEDNISLNSIKLTNVDSIYEGVIKRIFDMYNIPINLYKIPLYYTVESDYLLTHYECDLTSVIDYMKDNYDASIVSDIISIINKYTFIVDKLQVNEMIEYDLKHTYVNNYKYEESVDIISIDDISEDDYVFILDFREGSVPRIYKDEEYLSNKELSILRLDTTDIKNKNEKDKIINILKNNKNLIISYKDKDNNKLYYPSSLIKELNMEVVVPSNNYNYSSSYNKYKLCSMLDDYYKYNIFNDNMKRLYSTYHIDYKDYSNKFGGISFDKLNKILDNNLVLSYSAVEKYNECAFKYYVSSILKLDVYEDTFAAFIGSLFHHILEVGLLNDIAVEKEVNDYILRRNLDDKEKFYIDKLIPDIKFALNTIKDKMIFTKFNKYDFENKLVVYKNGKVSVTFKGFIDKMMSYEDSSKKIIAIVDYKTNDTDIKMDLLKYGLNIQLPIYLYLVNKNYPDAYVAGFYVQRVLPSDNKYDNTKSLLDRKKEEMKLLGYSNYDFDIISLFDSSYKDSNVIRSLKVKNDGNYSSNAKVLTNSEMKSIIEDVDTVIDNVINNISDCDFSINPKSYKNTNISCKYCKYKDLCFMSEEDIVYIKEEEDD